MSDDFISDDFIKAFLRPLPPITTPEERAVMAGFLKAIDEIASEELRVDSRLRMQDRIAEYDAREDSQSS